MLIGFTYSYLYFYTTSLKTNVQGYIFGFNGVYVRSFKNFDLFEFYNNLGYNNFFELSY